MTKIKDPRARTLSLGSIESRVLNSDIEILTYIFYTVEKGRYNVMARWSSEGIHATTPVILRLFKDKCSRASGRDKRIPKR